MPFRFFTFLEYLKYRFRARGAHGLHSPFLFDLYNQVIRKRDAVNERQLLELRRRIAALRQNITYTDPKTNTSQTISMRQLVRKVASRHNFSCFLVRFIRYLGYESVVETGTSIGLNAIYLSKSGAKRITTIEGSKKMAAFAQRNFEANNVHQINIVIGDVKDIFVKVLLETQPDLVFLDADHRSETIHFYLDAIRNTTVNVKCVIIHDIYWSPDMKEAWLQIISRPEYNLTIDLFQAGIIFPDYPIKKQHFTIKF